MTLNDFIIKNVPVHIIDIRRFSRPPFGGKQVDGVIGKISTFVQSLIVRALWRGKRLDGVIGTVLLYHFLATLDYPKGELILRRKAKENLSQLEEEAKAKNYVEGFGGGKEKVRAIPFVVEELTLGDAKEHHAKGLFAGPFPLEDIFGFRIGGLISHGFFKRYALTFDFTGMRLLLKMK